MSSFTNLILFRTNYFDSYLEMIAEELANETGFPICFVIDESGGVISIPHRFLKVSHTKERRNCSPPI